MDEARPDLTVPWGDHPKDRLPLFIRELSHDGTNWSRPSSCSVVVAVLVPPLSPSQEIGPDDVFRSVWLHVANVNVGRSNRLTRFPTLAPDFRSLAGISGRMNPASRRGLLLDKVAQARTAREDEDKEQQP